MKATGRHYGKNVVEDLRIFGKLLLLKGLLKSLVRLRDVFSTTGGAGGVGMTIFHFVIISWIFTHIRHTDILLKTERIFYI